jgi:aerobic carbon-monoxide dehydrogenase medium subunit
VIPFDFDYFKPVSIQETVGVFDAQNVKGKRPVYFCGGTEIITLGRLNIGYTEAVIDIKALKECRVMGLNNENLVIGSAITLTEIEEANLFPLLTKTASEVADRTARNKITLGGNICGRIFYREAVLPFLLADSKVVLAGLKGYRVMPMNEVFIEELKLEKGEFLVQLITDRKYLTAPFFSIKRRRQWYTGYPLVTVASLKIENKIRVAISGLCHFPFRSSDVETALNESGLTHEERVAKAIKALPNNILTDVEGSAEYRIFVLKHTLLDMMAEIEEAHN